MAIRLRDLTGGGTVTLEPLAGARAVVRADGAGLDAQTLLDFRLALAAELLERLLSQAGARVERRPAAADQPPGALLVELDEPGDGQPAARALLPVGGLLVEGRRPERMADDEPRVADALAHGASPEALRYFALAAPCPADWCFSWTGLAAAGVAREALLDRVRESAVTPPTDRLTASALALQRHFAVALADGLDTPAALAVLWETARADLPPAERRALLLDFDRILGLGLAAGARPAEELPAGAQTLIEERAAARQAKQWSRSDELRDRLAALGVETRDSPQGSVYRRRHGLA